MEETFLMERICTNCAYFERHIDDSGARPFGECLNVNHIDESNFDYSKIMTDGNVWVGEHFGCNNWSLNGE